MWLIYGLQLFIWLVYAGNNTLDGPIRFPSPGASTKGLVWPQPEHVEYSDVLWNINSQFGITTNIKCDIVDNAIKRYKRIIGVTSLRLRREEEMFYQNAEAILSVHIVVDEISCPKYPNLGMNERYTLVANKTHVVLAAPQVWGALRGLETFSQLFTYSGKQIQFRPAYITDNARFQHRGLLVDTARHFFAVPVLKAIIELCAMNKLNVFHWHIVDNEAFPYVSQVYPELVQGAYDSNHVYTVADVKEIVEFARLRGIRVIPEFDTPGHAASWRRGLDFMTTRCFDEKGQELEERDRAMLNIADRRVWDVLVALFKEVFELFPDEYFHMGGDETEYWMTPCWEHNTNFTQFMKDYELNSTLKVEQWYFDQLFKELAARDVPAKKFILWQEVLEMGVNVASSVASHYWRGTTDVMKNATEKGHFAIFSECWYLDHISQEADYKTFYACDPQNFSGTEEQKRLVLGGEAAMWAEMVDASNIIPRIFPRTSAIAEKLWSPVEFTSPRDQPDKVWPRLAEMQCRMTRRGYPIQPANGPSFCEVEYQPALPNWDEPTAEWH